MSILALASDTLSSPAAAGQIEYTSPIFAATSIGTQRGIVPTQQYYRLNSGLLVASTASAVSTFGVGVTLSASTVYEFEAQFVLAKTDGTTAHTIGIGFGGTATINNFFGLYIGNYTGVTANIRDFTTTVIFQSASNTTVTQSSGATTTLYMIASFKGTVSINGGGTFIPQYTCSAAPGGSGYTTLAGSYIRIAPLSASGSATNVGTWA